MNPQIALQLLLTIARISGTILAMFMAIIIFALRDEDLARLIIRGEPYGYTPLIVLSAGCITLVVQIAASLFMAFQINPGESYDDLRIVVALGLFFLSLVWVLLTFSALLWEKRDFLKKLAQTRK